MPRFSTTVFAVATGAAANAFTSLVGLKMANTAGHRGSLRRVIVSGGGGAPQDLQLLIRPRRTDNAGDGTATDVGTTAIFKHDPNALDSNVAAVKKNYSAEPTAKETGLCMGGSLNGRGNLVLDWRGDPKPPQWGPNQTMLIEGASSEASAGNLVVAVEWDED